MIYPRWFAKLSAYMLGYFWLPCPVCGEPFAGFESDPGWGAVLVHEADGPHMFCVCSKSACAAEGRLQVMMQRQSAIQHLIGQYTAQPEAAKGEK